MGKFLGIMCASPTEPASRNVDLDSNFIRTALH